MAWGRLALIQAAGERDEVLQQTAAIFGYEALRKTMRCGKTAYPVNRGAVKALSRRRSRNKAGKLLQKYADRPRASCA